MTSAELTRAAQHRVAEAMLAFHQQLAAVFRGDALAARRAHARASVATASALEITRELCRLPERSR